jgi:hypothetical protein
LVAWKSLPLRETHASQGGGGQNSVVRRMIKFMFKIFNLNGSSLQIRSKHRATSAGTQKCGMRFELSEFQSDTIKQTSNM